MTETDKNIDSILAGDKPTPSNPAVIQPVKVTPTPASVVLAKPNTTPTAVLPKTAVPTVAAKPTLSTAVNAAVAKTTAIPKGLSLFNTKDLDKGFFHAVLYSETSARKTSTAAQFGTPTDVRIILTRRPEQMLPLKEAGYEVALVTDAASLMFAIQFPEKLWPDWALLENRTLVLDDATEAVAMLLDDASEIDGKEVKDMRRSYKAAADDLKSAVQMSLHKKQNFIMVALAKVKENPLTNEERIGPDLPPSMLNLVLTEFEYVLYIKTTNWKMLTDRDFTVYKDVDPANPNKEKMFRREIFAKSKLPLSLVGKGVLAKEEEMNLKTMWDKIQRAKAGVAVAPVGVKK